MPRNFSFNVKVAWRDPRFIMRVVLGVFLAANLVAAIVAFKPFGGSVDDLRRHRSDLQARLGQLQGQLAEAKRMATKVEKARVEGDQFLERYIADRRTTFSQIFEELDKTAREAGIKPRDSNVELNEIEGSDTLEMMSITAGYEGKYENLEKFVNLLDRSPRFLIIESLVAAPQQGSDTLTVNLKLDTFVKETPGAS